MGKLPPVTLNPVPVTASELIVTAAVPLEVKVTDFDTDVPTATLPNTSDVALKLNAGVAAFSWIAKLFDEEFAVAVSVAVCDVVTDETVAENEAADEPEATVTLAGTVTAELLLARPTLRLDGADELSETVQDVEPAALKVLLPHEKPVTVGDRLDVPVEGLSLMLMDFELAPCVAVSVTVCAEVTAETLAANPTLFDPEATVTEAGTAIALPLLAKVTTIPPVGAVPFRLTVHASDPPLVIDVLAQLKPDIEGVPPFPCSFTVVPEVVVEVLLIAVSVSWPLVSVATFGS